MRFSQDLIRPLPLIVGGSRIFPFVSGNKNPLSESLNCLRVTVDLLFVPDPHNIRHGTPAAKKIEKFWEWSGQQVHPPQHGLRLANPRNS